MQDGFGAGPRNVHQHRVDGDGSDFGPAVLRLFPTCRRVVVDVVVRGDQNVHACRRRGVVRCCGQDSSIVYGQPGDYTRAIAHFARDNVEILGHRGQPLDGTLVIFDDDQSGLMFNRPTDICVHKTTGDLFISDGYGNSCVHKLKKDGKHVQSWGKSGTDPGMFNLPHSICILYGQQDRVLVADRENQRVQIFDLTGNYLEQWHAHRAVAVEVGMISNVYPWVYIAEQGTTSAVQRGEGMYELQTWTKNIGHRVGVYGPGGNGMLVSQFGGETPGENPGQFSCDAEA